MDSKPQKFLEDLRALRKLVKAEANPRIAKTQLRNFAEKLGERWFHEVEPGLVPQFAFPPEVLQKYSQACSRLIKISAPNNKRTSYLEVLDFLTKNMRDDLILPIKSKPRPQASTAFEAFVAKLKDPGESAYFQEAIECAKRGYLRAATVMGWCAAIDRIHRTIEFKGFSKFNVTSAQMASQQKGRFKRFNQTQNVTSVSELREVFDTIVLWILEGMGLIDSNQHTRLRSCFEMRCQCAHPGEAPITEYNLMSYFSDIQKIVLENPVFEVPTQTV